MKKALKGNQAVAYAVSQANIDFIPVYPITPQTSMIESIADFVRDKKSEAYYIPMESEHSVMGACIGAANAGVRVFTATSGQGLLYMHELLHWASGGRLPIVMGVVNRALAPGWNIWMDQTDTISQRDTGWIQIYCATHQELYDHLFIAYKLSEKVLLPSMLIQDAFFLSHTMRDVILEDKQKIETFLPGKPEVPFQYDFDHPKALGVMSKPENYMEFRYAIENAFNETKKNLKNVYDEFEKKFGRKYEIYDSYQIEDADTVLILSGTMYETAFKTVDDLRAEGMKAGIIQIRYLRPFFTDELKALVKGKKQIIVIDRNYSFGSGGVFATEIKSALYDENIPIQPVIAGLGGRDVTSNTIKHIVKKCLNEDCPSIYWEGEVYE